MKPILALAILMSTVSGPALAGHFRIITGNNGPTTVTTPYTGVVNKGTITGGSSTGLTVTGTAANKVINDGSISGTTGLSVSGSSSTVINDGTISGFSSNVAVGVYQVP